MLSAPIMKFLSLALLCLPVTVTMQPPQSFDNIVINGESYVPRPHEVNPELPEDMVWNQFPWHRNYMYDPLWYDTLGQDLIKQRRVWAIPTEEGQIDQFRRMLDERPERALDMMFEAAVKGRAHIIRFLLQKGVHTQAKEGEDETLVPLHAAAYQGHLDCVKVLIKEAKMSPNTGDEGNGTPVMRACVGGHAEILKYLLGLPETDATLREKRPEDDSGLLGSSALEFAALSGSVECITLLLDHAYAKGLPPHEQITPLTISSAAQSESIPALEHVLVQGNYPLLSNDDVCDLNDVQKEAIEEAFSLTLRAEKLATAPLLVRYITSMSSARSPNFPTLQQSTLDRIAYALHTSLPKYKPTKPNSTTVTNTFAADLFTHLSSLLFTTHSNPTIQRETTSLLNDAFISSAQWANLPLLTHLSNTSIHPTLDVNALSTRRLTPFGSTALYVAAAQGPSRTPILTYLLSAHRSKLDPHLGTGRYLNGPTALWISVYNQHPTTIRALLRAFHGPFEEIDPLLSSSPPKPGDLLIASATKIHRSPVKLHSEHWGRQHGAITDDFLAEDAGMDLQRHAHVQSAGTGESEKEGRWWKGQSTTPSGEEVKFVVLEVTEADAEWLGDVVLREEDEVLEGKERWGRGFKAKARAGGGRGESSGGGSEGGEGRGAGACQWT